MCRFFVLHNSVLCLSALVVVLLAGMSSAQSPTPAQRAQKLLVQMTLDEKLSMVSGVTGRPYVGNTYAIPRLGIPELHLEDGPQGVADGAKDVTCWPSALTVVAAWDPDRMYLFGQAMAKEQLLKGTNVMLGPMINIARVPLGGRNFESFGEDPCLTSTLVVSSVKGIQGQGVIACAKHFVDNNQEYDRTTVSENVPERAQWEIYYPAFKAAVDAGVGSIMCSYNKINNTYACENAATLDHLKSTMGFKGWVMSDWGATHSTVASALSGLDQEMPSNQYFGPALKQALQSGQVPQSRLDDMVLRILTPMFAMGIFDRTPSGNMSANARSQAHTTLARDLAAAGTVLLKNQANILPLTSSITSIAVIGDDGDSNPTYAGGGSGHVIATQVVTPLQGIKARAGQNVKVSYADTSNVNQAVQNAKDADVAIVFVATDSHEGADRANLSLSQDQNALVSAVSHAQSKTIVVLHHPGAVLMPWHNNVHAIIAAFLPGEQDGNAIADILFGDVNPSGRLPVTFPAAENQTPVSTPSQYPGINGQANYTEGLLVGYRWYNAKQYTPLFPFGHGLSYTHFSYSNLQVSGTITTGIQVSFSVRNIGSRAGNEVAQMYISYPETAGEPPKNMRAFQKVFLSVAQEQSITFTLHQQDVSVWDVISHQWQVVSGQFSVLIGASSQDIRAEGSFTV